VKPPEPFTWFVERSLGTKLGTLLGEAGFTMEHHATHFQPETKDEVWLRTAGERGWAVLSKDKAVRRNAVERFAIIDAGVAVFSLGNGNLGAEQMARAFIAGRARMERVLRRFDPPLTASVTVEGHVRVLLADGALLAPPRDIK
jgi:hypothetical protein